MQRSKKYSVLLGWHQQRHSKSQSLEQILQRPSSIVRCLCLIGLWLQCLFPHRLPNSHTGNRQYKHGAQQILSCLDSELQNHNVNTWRHWLVILKMSVKLGAITQAEVLPVPRESNRFQKIIRRQCFFFLCQWNAAGTSPKQRAVDLTDFSCIF